MDAHVRVLPIKEEAFWASIITKWSDACNNIVLLKTELEKAHSESRKYQECINALRAREEALVSERDRLAQEFEKYREMTAANIKAKEDSYHSQIQYVSTQSVSQVHDEVVRTKLREAEEGLVRAKNEYLRMKDQLSQSDEQLQRKHEELERKDAEIANLTLLKDKLQETNLTLMSEKKSLEVEFNSNKAIWEKQVAELNSLLEKDQEGKSLPLAQNSELDADPDFDRRNSTDVKLEQQKLAALSQEVESLKTNAATHKQENSALREELSSTYQKLHKANEMNKLLLDKNKTLSENLTRFNESLKLRDSALSASLAASQRDLTLTSTPAKQETTSAEPNNRELGCTIIKQKNSRVFICPPPPRTNRTPTSKTISSQPVFQLVSAWTSPTPMPEARQRTLAQLADYIPDVDCTDVRFRRALLASAIGGGIQSLIVRVTQSQTTLAKTHDISMYLCPALELNPWCPITPGQHGYMFVGLGQEQNTFLEPHVGLNVFLGKAQSSSKPKDYCYLGVYTAVRVNGLSVDEWKTLSDEFKTVYSNTTKEKNKDPRTVEAIRAAYDAGELSVPCVRLQSTDFNEGLYSALVAAHLTPSPPRPIRTAAKRRRDDEDYPARSRRLAPHESNVTVEPNNELC